MDDCLFCKIIKGEIPCTKLYEDDSIFAFLDIAPVNPGHVLVIPKEHRESFIELSEDQINKMFNTAQKIAKAVLSGIEADSFNLGMNVGKNAGQLVMHAHLHIMPRFPNDGHELFKGRSYEEGQAEEVAKRIKEKL